MRKYIVYAKIAESTVDLSTSMNLYDFSDITLTFKTAYATLIAMTGDLNV